MPDASAMPETDARKEWLSLLAKAPAGRLAELWEAYGKAPAFTWLRMPEIGTAMVRGRAGATGAPFNLGEVTVTRCSLQIEGGAVGHAYVQGRDKTKAEQAALIDGLMQGAEAEALRRAILAPLTADMERARDDRRAKAGATKVDFFTMVRGENT